MVHHSTHLGVRTTTLGTVFVKQVGHLRAIPGTTSPVITFDGVIDLGLHEALFLLDLSYHMSLVPDKELVLSQNETITLSSTRWHG